MDIAGFFYNASTWIFPVLLAYTVPEAVYGWVAWRLGDDTGHREGRRTWNIFNHVHPVGTVLLPVAMISTGAPLLFGWAKPIPVNIRQMHNPDRDLVTLSCARPATCILMALLAGLLAHGAGALPAGADAWTLRMLGNFIFLNLIFTVFSLLPIPPTDGGRIAVGLLPRKWGAKLAEVEPYGFMIIMGIFFVLPMLLNAMGLANPFIYLILYPVMMMQDAIFVITGHA
ncbi:site-2 protease family protein [Lacibacterium aquatile]|uniref:Site-2 protease family protein n=1 Tax=Lacibacterium aquatile TaxID=1168082 RepID=A0ABW5DNW8_9PROT